MKLKYFIEFYEEVDEDSVNMEGDELEKVVERIEELVKRYIEFSGIQAEGFKLEFDLEE